MATQVIINNPIINSPFEEPRRHYRFDEDGITDDIVPQRRISAYFVPIAQPKKKSKDKQLTFEDWTADRIEENKAVNFIRQRVQIWREGGYPAVTNITRRLLDHWKNTDRHRRLFFCQVEAVETLIYITEAANKYGDQVIHNDLKRFAEDANPELVRTACKMATGSGKTAVMAMIIVWQTLNKLARPQDNRFSDTFLVVTPGITIRDVYASSCQVIHRIATSPSISCRPICETNSARRKSSSPTSMPSSAAKRSRRENSPNRFSRAAMTWPSPNPRETRTVQQRRARTGRSKPFHRSPEHHPGRLPAA